MQRMREILLLLILIFSLGESALVPAQSSGSTTGSITGIVKDSQGAALGGATITARQTETNLLRTTDTDAVGSYQIVQLPPGNYEIKAECEGFAPKTEKVPINIGRIVSAEFNLSPAGTSEIIEVTAASAVDESKTESSTNIDRQVIDNLPINQRNFLNFAILSPRVITDRIPASGATATSGLSVNGQSGHFNSITIDGLDNNDFSSGSVRSTYSQDAVQEFQVVSDGFSAEFGRSLGGIVNIVTRSGTNEYHGNLFLFNRNDEIGARDLFSASKLPFSQYQFGLTLGGPIKRDRAFFFASFERLSVKQDSIITIGDEVVASAHRQGFTLRNGPVPFSLGTTSVLTRADFRLTPNDTLWARYNGGFTYNGAFESIGGLISETNSGTQRLKDNSIVANNTYINSRLRLVNETRFLYSRRNQEAVPFDNSPEVSLQATEGSILFGRREILPQPRQGRLYQIIDNVTLARGRNQIKFGVDFQYIYTPSGTTKFPIISAGISEFDPLDFAMLAGMPGLPSFTALQAFDPSLRTPGQRAFLTILGSLLPSLFPGFPKGLPLANLALPLVFAQGFGDSTLHVDGKLFSSFFQDDIKLGQNLLVKAGLRYDINRITSIPNNNGNVSPRLAISYHPGKLPDLHIHAAYGIFFGVPFAGAAALVQVGDPAKYKILEFPFPFSVLPFAMPGHHFAESEQLPPGVPFIPQFSQQAAFQRDFRNSYAQQVNLGFDYLIGGTTEVSLAYNFVRGLKLLGFRDINPLLDFIAGVPLQNAAVRPDPTRGDVQEIESAFDSYYHGLTVSVNRHFRGRFGFLASYTFSKAIDNPQPIFSNDSNVVETADDPLSLKGERGLSVEDTRSRFIFSGIWNLNYTKNRLLRDFQLSSIINLNSGRPYNLLSGVTNTRPAGLGRNVGITPGFADVDLRLTRLVTIKERFRIQAIVEAFNLFNRVNIDPNNINRLFFPDAQGNFHLPPKDGSRYTLTPDRFLGALAPRQFQLGLRISF